MSAFDAALEILRRTSSHRNVKIDREAVVKYFASAVTYGRTTMVLGQYIRVGDGYLLVGSQRIRMTDADKAELMQAVLERQ